MTLYVDSADADAVPPLLATGLFAGITTNPTILARSELGQDDLPDVYEWATAAGARTVFMQALGTDRDQLLDSGRGLRSIGDRVAVKVPATRAGASAARALADEGTSVLLTAVYHAAQALLAEAAGSHFIAPYVGRMTDNGRDGIAEAVRMRTILADGSTRVLAASLRSIDDIAALSAGGVQDFAIPVLLCEELLADPLTVEAAANFEAAWD